MLRLIRNSDAADSGSAFKSEFLQPAKIAVDTPQPTPPPVLDGTITPDTGGAFRIKPDADAVPPPPPEPVFKEDEPAPEKQPVKKDMGVKMETFLRVRNSLQSELLAMIAGTRTPEKYMLDDEQLNLLAEAYAPYADSITGMLPPWVMILAIEAITTGKKIVMAFDDRKQSLRNAKVANGQMKASVQPQATVIDISRPRTRWKIRTSGPYKGSYREDRFGKYMKQDEPGEMVDLGNANDMKEVIFSNGWQTVKGVFNLPDDWREKNNINTAD